MYDKISYKRKSSYIYTYIYNSRCLKRFLAWAFPSSRMGRSEYGAQLNKYMLTFMVRALYGLENMDGGVLLDFTI